ncbi:MAG TPA: membrane protein insertase YidC [Oleiagrimonas sp.]|nr:membrane protein insertase YidC [Oleiagrimonas sp.]
MNQTRTFLLLALAFVAYMLFNAWMNDYHRPPPPAPAASASVASAASAAIPTAAPVVDHAGVPAASAVASVPTDHTPPGATTPAQGQLIKVTTDALALTIDTRGGTLVNAHLLKYPEKLGSRQSVQLLSADPKRFYEAQSGLIGIGGHAAPNHQSLFHADKTHYALAPGQQQLTVKLDWVGPHGVTVSKVYTFKRGSYAIGLSQTIANHGDQAWQGQAYHQFERVVPPEPQYGNFLEKYSDQARYSFFGAAWYDPENNFNEIKFDDFKKHPLSGNNGHGRKVTGGWIAMEQSYFVGAWLKPENRTSSFSTATLDADSKQPHYLIRSIGPLLTVAPGQSTTSTSRLFLGPKLPDVLAKIEPSFHLALNYGFMTIIARPLHWVLAQLHAITHNWGWAIVLLVILINVIAYKLNAMQYRSAAHMRRLKPRMDQLKERYGDDKQKLQQATMELYKKEKVNPVAGCFPLLITLPIFFALYELLRESVELRQAPFIGWIHDLSAADPYFILPILYAIVMLIQSMTMPMSPGMDGMQQKIMKFMPVAYAVFFAFFPAGLALYYIVNTICRLLTQWWVYRQVDKAEANKKAAKA